jgi:pyruvate,water dikinase
MRRMLWWREEFRDVSTRFYYMLRMYTIEYAKKLEENAYKYIDTETWEEVYEGQQKQVESEQDSPL